MMPVKELSPQFEFAAWRVPQFHRSIEYPVEVMEEIRAFACDELLQLSHGGNEVGGLLFGTRRDDLIRVLTWRPMACDHTQGEGLRLSYNDRMNLAVQLEMARQNSDLKDLRPVGWFVSHSSGGISLSDSDLEIYNGFFPEAWQAALVIRPTGSGRAQAGFFMREADGKVQSEASYHIFELAPLNPVVAATKVTVPPPEGAPPQPPPVARPKEPEVAKLRQTPPEDLPAPSSEAAALQAAAFRAAALQALPPAVPPTAFHAPSPQAPPPQALSAPPPAYQAPPRPAPPTQALSVPPPAYQAPPPQAPPPQAPTFPPPAFQGRALQAPAVPAQPLQAPSFQIEEQLPSRERWYWAIPILLALGIAGFMLYQRQAPSPNASVALRASSEGRTVQLAWDANARAIRDSFRGEMEINDGSKSSQVSLTSDQLHAGKMSYQRQTSDVGFALTVYPPNGEPIHDFTRLIAPMLEAPTEPPQLLPASATPATPSAATPTPAGPSPAAQAAPPAADESPLQQEVQRLREDVSKERARADELQNLVRILENRLGIQSDPGKRAQRR
jgi:proteasome lid subunit RPN8/RPN11